MRLVLAENPLRVRSRKETPIQPTGHGEEGGTDDIFRAYRQDCRGVLGSPGVHLPVEDVNLKIVEVLTDDYEFEQRTILYKDDINRAEIEAIVRQRYTIMSASTKVRNVGPVSYTHLRAPRDRG